MMNLDDDLNVCLSGGAEGADQQWGMCAGMAGHKVIHFIFAEHRSKVPESEKVVLTSSQLLEADSALEKANKTLKRRWPVRNPFVASLLRRNFFQVRWASSLYAVATLEKGMVSGGTAWAVQMFLDRFGGQSCPAYVYDQATASWYVWEGSWVAIDAPPVPEGIWAGIGSRDLKQNGKDSIRSLLGYHVQKTQTE